MSKIYTAPDGTEYPVYEADYDMAFKVYKSNRRRARRFDGHDCFVALGIRRHPDVLDCYIGSGQHAYVIFKGKNGKPPFAVHFIVPRATAKARDLFETKGAPKTQIIMLLAPSPAQTLAGRAAAQKKWREAVKNGKSIQKRGSPNKTRIMRLGVPHRPHAKISRAGADMSSGTF